MRTARAFLVGLIVGTLALTSFSCVGAGSADDRADLSVVYPSAFLAATDPESFTMATIGEPDYLDPAVDYETSGGEIIQNVYETLVWYDRDSTNLVPMLAVEIPTVENGLISADGMSYTFHVKPGVIFQDWTPLTADDVVYSIQRVLRIHDPAGPSWMLEQVLTDYVSYYIGSTVAEYLAASNHAPWIVSALKHLGPHHVITETDVQTVAEAAVVKVDEMTAMFRLTHPYAGFLKIMATTVASVVSMDFVETNGGIQNGWQSDFMNTHTCGTGPYMLVSWTIGDRIDLTRFNGYHGALPALRDIHIVRADEVNTRILMLQAGDADSVYLPIYYESTFAGDADYRIVKGLPTFDLTFIAFNFNIDATTANSQYGGTITVDFFSDIHMRKAFTHLLDYSEYITNVNKGNAIQPNGMIPKGMFGYDAAIPKYTYDLAAAEAEFKLAINPGTGNSYWDDGFTIPLFYNAGNIGRQTACEMMKLSLDTLASPGGMTATVNALDWPTYLSQAYNTNGFMPMYAVGWTPDYADPDDYAYPLLDSSSGYYPSYTGYQNPEIEELARQAASELDPGIRAGMYNQLSMLVYEDVPYIWLTQPGSFHVERSWVNGYYFNPMYGGLYYAALSKSPPVVAIHVSKMIGTPAASSVSWIFTPAGDGTWTAQIESSGLKYLVLDVYDATAGVQVLHQKIKLSVGSVTFSLPVYMTGGHMYNIVAMPVGGATGSSATILDLYI